MKYKMHLKVISVVLVCALVLQSIPISVAAQTQEIAEQTTEETSAYIIGEDISKREMSVKHFRMSDGSYKAAVYPYPVHYENEQGELLDIDNSLYEETDEADNVLSNRQNSFSVKFMKKSNPNKLYTLDKNGYKIKVAIEGAKKVSLRKTESQERISNLEDFILTNIGSKVVYEEILENADIEYSLVSNELKENIVLKKKADFNRIIYTYHLNGSLEAKQNDNKNITLYDKDGNFVLDLSAPVMWDAEGNYNDSLYLELLEVKNSEIKIKLYWNMPENAVYPVTIDPVMRLSADRTAIQDTHIIARYPNDNYNDNNHLRVRNDGYTMIKFPMPQLNSGDKIINAQLVLAPYGAFDSAPLYSNVNSFSPPLYITTHKILRSWNEKTDTYSSVDPENNFYDSTAQSYRIVDGDSSYYTWDITRLVNEWIDGYSENYGILLKYAYPAPEPFDTFFCSTNGKYLSESACPDIVYQYINTSGIEDYYSYHTQSLGYAGTAYTNDFTGNLTLINNVLTTGGSLSPINVSLVYNLSAIVNDTVPYGSGWKLNLAQKIDKSITSNYDDTPYLRYTDGDGTDHYFTEDTSESIWKDEVNPDRKVHFVEDTEDYKMTDSGGTNMYFTRNGSLDEWYLYKIEDIYGNYQEITLDANNYNRVLKATSSSGSVVDFEYNDYGYLSDIVYADGEDSKRIEIEYNNYMESQNSSVTDIIYADGTRVKYHYHEGTKNLSKAIDIDGQYVYYGYTVDTLPRVNSIKKYNRNAVEEAAADISYSVTSTTFADVTNQREYLYTFASNGTLKSVVDITVNDGNGYGQYYEFNNSNTTETEGMNRLTFLSKTQKSTVNLLTNHSFENSGYVSFTAFDETELSASGTFSNEIYFIGSRSYKITIPEDSDSSRAFGYFSAYLEGGKTYTLSAYVNTKDMVSADKGASVAVIGSEHIYESEYITESKDNWQRLYVTFTPSLSENVNVGMSVSGATGSVYFDNIQLEIGGISDYNILENAGLENSTDLNPDYWCEVAEHGKVTTADKISGNYSASLIGSPNEYSQYRQLVPIANGKKGDTYVASAFAKATSAIEDSWNFSLLIRFMYEGERVNDCDVDFNKYTTQWQKVSVAAKAEQDYDQIQIWLLYYRNCNTAYFDNVQLIKDTFGTAYTYDDNGNLISTVDLQGKEEYTFNYDGNNQLIKQTNISGSNIFYTYNKDKEQQLDIATVGGNTTYYDYDSRGNGVATSTYGSTLTEETYYYLKNVRYSMFLSVADSQESVCIKDYDESSNQRWKLIKNSDNTYSFSPECQQNKILSVSDSVLSDFAPLTICASGEKTYQRFTLIKQYGNIYYIDAVADAEFTVDCSPNIDNAYVHTTHRIDVQQFIFIPVQNSNTAENPAIISSATYSDNGEYMTSLTDSRGNTVSYEYNEDRGYITAETDVNGVDTEYSYYSNELLQRVSKDSSSVNYSYTAFKELSSITSPSGTVYNFEYDASGRNTAVKIGATTLSSYLYDSKGRLDTLTYGNGHSVKYGYDALGRQTSTTINNVLRSLIKYDGTSRISERNDLVLGKTVKYEYDILDRAVGEKYIDNSTKLVYAQMLLRYDDTKNRLAGYDTTVKGTSYTTDYLYGENNNVPDAITGIKLNGTKIIGYDYDSLNRLKSRTLNTTTPFVTEYTYVSGRNKGSDTDNTALTTTLVKTLKNGNDILEYTYDKTGNITSVAKNGTVIESYEYDSLNQLTQAAYGGNVYTYTYDDRGNIQSVAQNGTVKKTLVYGNSNWKDLLTSYNGRQLTYDQIGNPNNWRTGFEFTWSYGRRLTGITKGTDSISYTYDVDGLRTSKTVNGTTTEYYWLEGILQGQKTGSEYIVFLYDENGTAYGMLVDNGTTAEYYYYLFNIQGDVVGIMDSTGTQVVSYTYSPWGELLSTTGSLADTIGQKNPLRYRGYYYDTETGFYLTGTRYYDPEIGRFINADGEISDVGGNVLGYNLFAYCFNNPVNMDDPTGQWPKWIGKAIAVVAVAAVVVAAVAVTVSTFGAGSVAGVAAISAAVTIAARATEVAVLQVKKSKNTSQNTGVKTSGNNSSNGGNGSGGGGSNTQKSNGQVAVDVTEALFDNGVQIMGITPYTKAGSIGFNHILNQQVSKIFGETTTLRSTLSATGGKVVPYAFAAYAWCKTTISIFSDDPVQRAEQRGYTLK